MRLRDKLAMVTCAGDGIGRAIAEQFAAEAANVLATHIDLDSAMRVAEAIVDPGGTAVALRLDVRAPAEIAAAALSFASGECSFTTGHVLTVDGGSMATRVIEA